MTSPILGTRGAKHNKRGDRQEITNVFDALLGLGTSHDKITSQNYKLYFLSHLPPLVFAIRVSSPKSYMGSCHLGVMEWSLIDPLKAFKIDYDMCLQTIMCVLLCKHHSCRTQMISKLPISVGGFGCFTCRLSLFLIFTNVCRY